MSDLDIDEIVKKTDGMKLLDFKSCIQEASTLPEKEYAANTGLDMSYMD